MSKDETLDELLESWKMGDQERVLAIIQKNPNIIHKFELVKKKEHSFG